MELTSLLDIGALALSNQINVLFTSIMLFIFLVSFAQLWRPQTILPDWRSNLADQAQGLLPTLGILGTFVGISIGLLQFRTSNIEKSIPFLLDGLKTSFVTSVVGVTLAVALKLFAAGRPTSTRKAETAEEAILQMAESSMTIGPSLDSIQDGINKLRSTIAGDEDTSLVSQLQKLRTESKDANAALLDGFTKFASVVAENNSKALISALESVIKDFNVKLTEQFGENFKQLNAAVRDLVVWQEQYKGQLNDWIDTAERELKLIKDTLNASGSSLSEADKALSSIAKSLEPIPDTMESLSDLIRDLDEERVQIERGMSSLAKARQSAEQAIPVIQSSLDQLVAKFSRGVEAALTHLHNSTDQHNKKITDFYNQLEDQNRRSRESFDRTMRETMDLLKRQVENLDASLETELKKAIETMGSHLASLSNKFVSDYTPLTDRLREVVELSQRLRRQ